MNFVLWIQKYVVRIRILPFRSFRIQVAKSMWIQADPDTGQALPSQKLNFTWKYPLYVGNKKSQNITTWVQKPFWKAGVSGLFVNLGQFLCSLDPDPGKTNQCNNPLHQGVTKRCRLSLLTYSAHVIRVQLRGKGGVADLQGHSQWVQLWVCTSRDMEPKWTLEIYIHTVFNLCFT